MDHDLDDTRAAAPAAPVAPIEPETHDAPDLEDTVITGVARVPAVPVALVEPTAWPTPSWPSALDPVPVPAPVYSFRIGYENEPVSLESIVYVGRKPVPPRIPGVENPRLVTVSSPKSEVSGTHLELRQRGAAVVVTDLRSTNGSVVVIPGSAPRRMRQGESVVVTPGTLIDIGDGNVIEILATRVHLDEEFTL